MNNMRSFFTSSAQAMLALVLIAAAGCTSPEVKQHGMGPTWRDTHPQADALAYLNRSNAKYTKGDMNGAIADATKAIELKPDDVIAYFNRGIEKHTKGDMDGAIADYTKAIELEPDYVNAYVNRGNEKRTKGDMDGAIADYTKAIELGPDYAEAYSNRGTAKEAKGDIDGAIADRTKANELNPKAFPFVGQKTPAKSKHNAGHHPSRS